MKRMRIVAGPNGSGKSTVISELKGLVNLYQVINADEIAVDLKKGKFPLSTLGLQLDKMQLIDHAKTSGLSDRFPALEDAFDCVGGEVLLHQRQNADRLAQLVAQAATHELIRQGKSITYETVFSHENKVELMMMARAHGFKVYLYFVCTESPEVNVSRVDGRRQVDGGHWV